MAFTSRVRQAEIISEALLKYNRIHAKTNPPAAAPLLNDHPVLFFQRPCVKKTVMAIKNPQLPPGYEMIAVRTTYLEMKARPETEPQKTPAGCLVQRWPKPGIKKYKALFAAVGNKWGWSGRLLMAEEELKGILRAPTTEVYRLRCQGGTAGFVELDRRGPNATEIAYFGLLPEFIGRGLGKFLLDWAIRRAWRGRPGRVWLHTCEHDHFGALAVYLKAGFRVCGEKIERQPYPDGFAGRLPPAGG
jgi:GNAT superfamily N-acetyltransferase